IETPVIATFLEILPSTFCRPSGKFDKHSVLPEGYRPLTNQSNFTIGILQVHSAAYGDRESKIIGSWVMHGDTGEIHPCRYVEINERVLRRETTNYDSPLSYLCHPGGFGSAGYSLVPAS